MVIRSTSSTSLSAIASYCPTQTGRYDAVSVTSCGGSVPATTLPLTSSGLTLPSRTVALGHRSLSILIVAGCRLTIKLGASYSTRSTLRHPASRSASQTSWAVANFKPLGKTGAKKGPKYFACKAAASVPTLIQGPSARYSRMYSLKAWKVPSIGISQLPAAKWLSLTVFLTVFMHVPFLSG